MFSCGHPNHCVWSPKPMCMDTQTTVLVRTPKPLFSCQHPNHCVWTPNHCSRVDTQTTVLVWSPKPLCMDTKTNMNNKNQEQVPMLECCAAPKLTHTHHHPTTKHNHHHHQQQKLRHKKEDGRKRTSHYPLGESRKRNLAVYRQKGDITCV